MFYKELLRLSSQIRIGYLTDVLKAVVSEGQNADGAVSKVVAETLKVFNLTDEERDALLREALEQLNKK